MMKLKLLFLVLFLFSMLPHRAFSEEMRKYQIESGIIDYDYTGFQKGTQTVYFDQWGAREAIFIDTEVKMDGRGMTPIVSQTLSTDGWVTIANLIERTGVKMPDVTNMSLLGNISQEKEQGLTSWIEIILSRMGGKIIGQEEVAGKLCDVWYVEQIDTKHWIWNSLTLKTDSVVSQVSVIATKVEVNVKVDDDKFLIPDDIDVVLKEDNPFEMQATV